MVLAQLINFAIAHEQTDRQREGERTVPIHMSQLQYQCSYCADKNRVDLAG